MKVTTNVLAVAEYINSLPKATPASFVEYTGKLSPASKYLSETGIFSL